MPQNNNKTAKTIISRLSVVLFEEIKNLKIKPKIKPIAKQMIFSIIGQPTSIKPTEPLEIPIQIAIATL